MRRRSDHRKLGKELGLFYSEDVGPGLPLFTPKGEMLRHLMEGYVRETQTRYGYEHVWTGHLVKEDLYRRSGHYENYKDSMFPPIVDEGDGNRPDIVFRLKPMNCPSHMTLYKEMGIHSYREPRCALRSSPRCTAMKTGELTGLTRVRALTQDDCHTFCTEDQVESDFYARSMIQRCWAATASRTTRVPRRRGGRKYVQDEEMGQGGESAAVCPGRQRRRLLRSHGRGFLWAEGRLYRPGCPGARVAAVDDPGGLHPTRPLRIDVYRRGRAGAYAGRVSPRGDGHDGALHGRDHRALRRGFPGLAVPGAGRPDPHRGPPRAYAQEVAETLRPPGCAWKWTNAASG